MTRYEHVRLEEDAQTNVWPKVQQMGSEGWTLVAVVSSPSPVSGTTYYLRRVRPKSDGGAE